MNHGLKQWPSQCHVPECEGGQISFLYTQWSDTCHKDKAFKANKLKALNNIITNFENIGDMCHIKYFVHWNAQY